MPFQTKKVLKKIDPEKADEVISRATADLYPQDLPSNFKLRDPLIRKSILIPSSQNLAFYNYMVVMKKNGVKTNFNRLVVELLEKHLKDFYDR